MSRVLPILLKIMECKANNTGNGSGRGFASGQISRKKKKESLRSDLLVVVLGLQSIRYNIHIGTCNMHTTCELQQQSSNFARTRCSPPCTLILL